MLPSAFAATGKDWSHALRPPAGLPRSRLPALVLAVAAAHGALATVLLKPDTLAVAGPEPVPLLIDLMQAEAPAPTTAPAPAKAPGAEPARSAAARPAAPTPLLPMPPAVESPVSAPAPPTADTPTPAPATPAPPAAPVTSPPALAAPVAAGTPAPGAESAAPRLRLPSTAVRYRVPPPVELPRASRRAGESGVVWLRVLVDVRGLPTQVRVQHSSGFARLDEQALWALQQARFQPHTENGSPVEVEVIAPVEYPLE